MLCIPQVSFQPEELQGKEEPSHGLVSISSPSSPGFTPRAASSSSWSFCTGNRLLPRPKQKDATALCQASSRRTHLSITVSTGVLPWPLDPSPTKHRRRGEQSCWMKSTRSSPRSKELELFKSRSGAQSSQGCPKADRVAPCAAALAKQHVSPSIPALAYASLRGESSHLLSPLLRASHPSCHSFQQRQPASGSPWGSKLKRNKQFKIATCCDGLGLKTLRFWELPNQETPRHCSHWGSAGEKKKYKKMGDPETTYILGFLFNFIPVALMERYSLPAQTFSPFRLSASFLKAQGTFTLTTRSEDYRQMLG